MAKIEREKVIQVKFTSKMTDVGEYSQAFLMKRKTVSLDVQVINAKSMLAQGLSPIARGESQFVDTIATISVYCVPLDKFGKPETTGDWVDDILDQEILWQIHGKWLDYQKSFYPPIEEKKDEPAAPDVQTTQV